MENTIMKNTTLDIDKEFAYIKGNSIRTKSEMPQEIYTKELDRDYIKRTENIYWTTYYKGDFSEMHPKELPYYKNNLELRDKILDFGGQQVVMPFIEEDLERIMDRGQLWYGDRTKMITGLPSQCHYNSAVIATEHMKKGEKIEIRLATGYALSEDGLWRQHSWCVQNTPKENIIIETTTKRLAYFGFVLSDEETNLFFFNNI